MTFVVKTRGAGAWLRAEYRCPEHGVFEATVQRDENGDAPDEQPCPEVVDEEMTAGAEPVPVTCGERSPWTISAPLVANEGLKVRPLVRGGDMKERPPGMLDTRPLAEGMKYSEWKKLQREETRRRRHKQLVDKGVIQKKVIVG